MVLTWENDGSRYSSDIINSMGFFVDESKDIKSIEVYDQNTSKKMNKTEITYNFVGFLTNNDNDVMAVFPKHYEATKENIENDCKSLFSCISKHMQKRPKFYMGDELENKYESNYPFAEFFNIYRYYTSYGLYFEDKTFIKSNTGGRVNWKYTISKSNKYIISGNLSLYPIYFNKKYHFSNFITECMIFAIDYTIDKFRMFIGLEQTGKEFPENDFWNDKEYVIGILQQFRQQTFKDIEVELLDNLIKFFSMLNIGGNYYIKHYKFSSIWEDMVMEYLRKYYDGIDASGAIIFNKTSTKHLNFKKESFHPNLAKLQQYISPDYYCVDGDIQLIFDAKYNSYMQGINYKQLVYTFILKEIRETIKDPNPKFTKTYSSLILPSEERSSKPHFQMNPIFNLSNKDIFIMEEYVEINDVMASYIEL